MNGVTKSVILALAVSALPLVAHAAADKASDKASKDWPTFRKVDADNNGSISMDEARTLSGLSDSFTSYDKNADGQLSRAEYESAKKAQKTGRSSSGPQSSRTDSPAGGAGSAPGTTAPGPGSTGGGGDSGSSAGSSGSGAGGSSGSGTGPR
jgi:hypothetical protein